MDGSRPVADARRRHALRHRLDELPGGDASRDRPRDRPRRGRQGQLRAAHLCRPHARDRTGPGRHRDHAAPLRGHELADRGLPHRAAGRAPGHPPRRRPGPQGVDGRGGRDRHQRHLQPRPGDGRVRAVLRRDRLVPAGRGHPAQHVGAARPARPHRRAGPDAADRPAAAPARRTQRAPAPPHGRALQHRQRHRRWASGAARDRRRGRLPRPLPARVAGHPTGRRTGRSAAVGAGRAPGVPARCVRGPRGLGRGQVRRPGPDQPRRARRVLRLLGVPHDPAADRHRVRQQADPRPGLGPPRDQGAGAHARPPRPGGPGRATAPGRGACGRPHRAQDQPRADDRAGQRPARRGRRPRGPTRALCTRGGRRRDPGRRTAHEDAPRRRTPPDRGLGHRRHPVLGPPRNRARHRRRGRVARPRDRLDRRHPGGAARRPRHRGRRARPDLLRRPAAAAGPGPRPGRRPGDPRPGRADLRGGRPHRGPDRLAAARPPRGPDHHRGHVQPAGPRRGRRGGLPAWRSRRGDRRPPRPARERRRLPRRGDPGARAGRGRRHEPQHRTADRGLAIAAPLRPLPGPPPPSAAVDRVGAPRHGGPGRSGRALVDGGPRPGGERGHHRRPRRPDHPRACGVPGGPDDPDPVCAADQPGAGRAGAGRAARGLRRQRAGAAGRRGRVGRLG